MGGKLEIAICDDEKYYRQHIKELIDEYLNQKDILFNIDVFEDGKSFCKEESNLHKYDIIFLDIDMEGMNGMETAYAIREINSDMDIVFITVMSEYVFEGYKVSAVRFIKKMELDEVLTECLNALMKKRQHSDQKIEFSFVGGKRRVALKEILYIESKSHKLHFEKTHETLYMYGQISELESRMSDCNFVRCHQSYLVNLEHIEKINNYWIFLSDGTEIPVSKPKYPEVKRRFLQYKEI